MLSRSLLSQFVLPVLSAGVLCAADRPNILVVVADDQSWANAGAYGDKAARTPNFDALAKNGVLFTQAYCSSPSCSPSRAALLTGKPFSTLEQAANLRGPLAPQFAVYPEKLEAAGYVIGYSGKGWGPGDIYAAGRTTDPLGAWYMNGGTVKKDDPAPDKHQQDISKNLTAFLDTAKDKPFCFWYGSKQPHRPYKPGDGKGIDQAAITVPPFFPDVPVVRGDLADYLGEIEQVDRDLGAMIETLKARGLLENTLIVYTSDNGMPFPRCKGFLYDYGSRMPLAIQWLSRIPRGHVVDDFVGLMDLAPTFLESAGLPIPPGMTGRSLLPILMADRDGRIDPSRDKIFLGRERHSRDRLEDGQSVGYPMRGVRTDNFLYIRNFKTDRSPAADLGTPIDTDKGPTRNFLGENKAAYPQLWELSFGKRPAEELYDVKADPYEIHNLAADPAYAKTKAELASSLTSWMQQVSDPRATSAGDVFDKYPAQNRPGPKGAGGGAE